MSMPFQPLGCSLHGVQTRLPEHDQKEQHMASTRADASQRIVAALDSKGGMLTAAQLREELRDLEPGVRYTAVNHLKNTGVIESQGKASNIIYSLVRSGPLRVEEPQVAEATASPAADAPLETPPPTAETSGIQWGKNATLLLDANHRVEGVRFEDPAPYAMTDRLDAIADDLQDALEDACRARLPHALISALVTSSGALRLARKTLTA